MILLNIILSSDISISSRLSESLYLNYEAVISDITLVRTTVVNNVGRVVTR